MPVSFLCTAKPKSKGKGTTPTTLDIKLSTSLYTSSQPQRTQPLPDDNTYTLNVENNHNNDE